MCHKSEKNYHMGMAGTDKKNIITMSALLAQQFMRENSWQLIRAPEEVHTCRTHTIRNNIPIAGKHIETAAEVQAQTGRASSEEKGKEGRFKSVCRNPRYSSTSQIKWIRTPYIRRKEKRDSKI